MAQITLYVDERTAERLRQAAAAAGQSQSQWVGEAIRRQLATTWPEEVRLLAGSWPDFPDPDELRASVTPDADREPL